MNILITLLSGAAIITVFYIWTTFNYWKKRGVNTLNPNILLGNLSDVILRRTPTRRMFKDVYAMCKKNGDKFMGFYFLHQPALVIVDPELVKNVLAKDFNSFTDRPFYINEKDRFSVNLVSAKGKQWKTMREQLTPAFSPSKIKNIVPTLMQVSDHLRAVTDKCAENNEIFDLKDVSSKYLVDAIGMSIFGIECNTLQNSNMEFRNNAQVIVGGTIIQNIKLTLSMLYPSILIMFNIPLIGYKVQKFYLNLVESTVEHRENNNIVRNDLMHSIIQLRNNINIEKRDDLVSSNISEDEKSLNIPEITAQVLIFMGAAYETTAATISLCIYELCMNEDIQSNLRSEIVNILGEHEDKISYEAIMKMTYLDQCVLETLRKYALVSMMARTCNEKYPLPNSNVVLDVGSTVYIPSYEIHHDPEYYPNPEKFDPERFSSENKSNRPSFTFLSLGEGQRNCIGGRLGLLKIKIFLVTFLANYNFTINLKTQVPPALNKSSLVVCLDKPLYLNVQKI